ncbi:MAG: hypothetical protein AAF434_01585 [Pseudomonadota bacterium]
MDSSTIFGVIVGGLISWWLTRHYYKKSNVELRGSLDTLTKKLASKDTLEEYERMLENSEWVKEYEGIEAIYVCKLNPTFQFDMKGEGDDFFEKWMSVFPDRNGKAYDLKLRIGGVTVKVLRFISADGGRYTVPLPEVYLNNEKQEFVWRKNSLEYKISDIIGNYYRYKTLEEVSKFVKVDLITEQRYA